MQCLIPRDDRISKKQIQDELYDSLTHEEIAYMLSVIETNPQLYFTLVATPNVPANSDQIERLILEFSQSQPHGYNIWNNFYSKYSDEELSYTNQETKNRAIFSFIPNMETLYGTVEELKYTLAELQKTNPYIRIPKVVTAITYWYTLRAQNYKPNKKLTRIRHIDLPEQQFYKWKCVPESFIHNSGTPHLDNSDINIKDYMRIEIG